MEALRRKRTQLRRQLTMLADRVEAAVRDQDDSARELYEALSETAPKLFDVEAALRDVWCAEEKFDEAAYEADQDKSVTYELRWHKVKTLFSTRKHMESTSSLQSAESTHGHPDRNTRKPALPKLELAKFDGNAKNWLLFWGQFKKIDQSEEIDAGDKFQYLLLATTPNSSARQLVEAYPPCAENYKKALEALKSRFARDEVLIETYVRGLLALMSKKGDHLARVYDSLTSHLQALDTLGVTKDKYAAMLLPMIESTLPEDVLRAWHRSKPTCRDLPNLMDFLRQEVESEERIRLARQDLTDEPTPSPPTACFVTEAKPAIKAKETSLASNVAIACVWCDKQNHSPVECHKAAKMSLKEKTEHLKAKNACGICLKQNHTAKRCKSFPKCLFCKKRHYTMMCREIDTRSGKAEAIEATNNMLCEKKPTTTLLQTLAVKLVHQDKEVVVRALIDSGAQRSYIKRDLAKKIGLQPYRKEAMKLSLFGGFEAKEENCDVFDICLKNSDNNFCLHMSVVEQQNICNSLPKLASRDVLDKLRQKGIVLTETCDSPSDISVLIGADYSGLLLTADYVQLDSNLTAIKTKLGWTIQGPITGIYSSLSSATTTLHCLTKLDISELWSLEALGIRDPVEQKSKTAQALEVIDSFEKSISVNEEGRYEVGLPWRDVPRPQTNYEIAERRLTSTTKSLQQKGKIHDYDKVFREWLDLGIIEVAPDQAIKGHYIPHHAVIKESSATTKIRPVFDASAKDRQGISLNSCLEKGVNLIENIPDLLINFRKYKIGVTSDIAKAFLQISLAPRDRDYLRFLWWSNLDQGMDKAIITYRHRRVVFGVTSSPFHLAATINHHLKNCDEQFRETVLKLRDSFYVDNCVTSLESEQDVLKFVRESKEVMLEGKFDLRGWITGPMRVDGTDICESAAVLGVLWNIKKDTLQCCVNLTNITEKLSKRTLLSVAQRVFDPIGVTCPTTIIPKMIMQKSWDRKISWDDELPEDLGKEFKKWLELVHHINECTIPRRLTSVPIDNCKLSLHVFCDASKDAYSTCIFLRSELNEHVEVRLVVAKSRVTPRKEITVPRLELIAATMASRLSVVTMESLKMEGCEVHYWSDSSVVLAWIKNEGPWSVFVSNRVKEIKSLTNATSWKHVPGNLNPADLPSRGTSPKGLVESQWWKGPTWLSLNEDNWPAVIDSTVDKDAVEIERKKGGSYAMINIDSESILNKLIYFSRYTKIVRMMCWMLRWKRKAVTTELTYNEFEYAEKLLIKLIQNKYEDCLVNNKNLKTFVDKEGIVRLDTKLALGSERYEFKYPIVLPGAETIVQRLVEWRHIELKHVGQQTLLCNLRQTFWIVGVRKLVRTVIHRCLKCKRLKAKRCQAPIGVLPKQRLEASSAFQCSGVDLAGPLILRSGSKAWIVLFTCATYRAVHLEVVESLSTGDFLMALRRFVARRGRVQELFSDNATNFRGLDNAMAALDWNEIQRFSAITRIKWHFLPPAAPWWGGFYERLIGFLKQILGRTLGRASLKLIELMTVICDCEAVINNRPLTYVFGQESLRPLTPAMFIQPLESHPGDDFDKVDECTLNARHKYCQELRDVLRRRFRDEYVAQLLQKRERATKEGSLQVGDVVLMEGEGKRLTWPLAIVEQISPGADGVGRVAHIRTAAGVRVRPIQRLFSLEVHHDRDVFVPDVRDTQPETTDMTDRRRTTRKTQLPRHLFDYELF